jgi:hypothetical protein
LIVVIARKAKTPAKGQRTKLREDENCKTAKKNDPNQKQAKVKKQNVL